MTAYRGCSKALKLQRREFGREGVGDRLATLDSSPIRKCTPAQNQSRLILMFLNATFPVWAWTPMSPESGS